MSVTAIERRPASWAEYEALFRLAQQVVRGAPAPVHVGLFRVLVDLDAILR